MAGKGFLAVAQDVAVGTTEFHWRAAVIHAYYALFLECRDTLSRWGFAPPRRDNVHAWVRLRLIFATDTNLQFIGDRLDRLVRWRNQASYNMQSRAFTIPVIAQDAIHEASISLTLLDQIDGDPVRRAAAIASIRP